VIHANSFTPFVHANLHLRRWAFAAALAWSVLAFGHRNHRGLVMFGLALSLYGHSQSPAGGSLRFRRWPEESMQGSRRQMDPTPRFSPWLDVSESFSILKTSRFRQAWLADSPDKRLLPDPPTGAHRGHIWREARPGHPRAARRGPVSCSSPRPDVLVHLMEGA
jgi:hypothetical protein